MKSMLIAAIIVTILKFSVIIILVFFIIKNISKRPLASNIKKIIAMIYCIILLVALLVLNIIPNKNFMKSDYSQLKSNYNDDSVLEDFKQLILDGKVDSSKEFIKNGSNSMKSKLKLLKIVGSEDGNAEILIQHKNAADGKIDITEYAGKSILKGVDLTNKLQPLGVILKDGALTIGKEVDKEINVSRFAYDLTANQFINDKNYKMDENYSGKPYYAMRFILIKIPKDVQIDTIYPNAQMITN